MMLKQEILEDIINRIVETVRPEKIILFGSAARGEMGPNSDVDLLIIRKGGHSRKLVGHRFTANCMVSVRQWTPLWSLPRTWSAIKTATR